MSLGNLNRFCNSGIEKMLLKCKSRINYLSNFKSHLRGKRHSVVMFVFCDACIPAYFCFYTVKYGLKCLCLPLLFAILSSFSEIKLTFKMRVFY